MFIACVNQIGRTPLHALLDPGRRCDNDAAIIACMRVLLQSKANIEAEVRLRWLELWLHWP
jgi:hypothetical protein